MAGAVCGITVEYCLLAALYQAGHAPGPKLNLSELADILHGAALLTA